MLAVSDGTRDAFVKLEVVAALLFRTENEFLEKVWTRNVERPSTKPISPTLTFQTST